MPDLKRTATREHIVVAKWTVFIAVTRRLHGTKWFWAWIFGLPLAGVATHLLYRHKTHAWTRPWGGWNDVDAVDAAGRSGRKKRCYQGRK